jgi:hypothetical protein
MSYARVILSSSNERAADRGGCRVTTVDCAECVMRDTAHCADCVVSFIVNRVPGEAIVIDADAARAVRLLARAGLVPALRHTVVP